MEKQKVPILVYHHVYPDDTPNVERAEEGQTVTGIISVSTLRKQLQFIKDEGWTVISTTQLSDWLKKKTSIPEMSVVLQFDNGWLDTLNTAVPLLAEFGYTSICYAITQGVQAATEGKESSTRTRSEGVIVKPFLTWDGVKRLVEAGCEIGAHTHTHCQIQVKLEEQGADAIIEEVEISNQLFEQGAGLAPAHFAYPSGSRSQSSDDILAPKYTTLRRWRDNPQPINWVFTDADTPLTAIECQNIDNCVRFEDFTRIFQEAS